MRPLNSFPLGKGGIDYVMSCLQSAEGGLCRKLLELPIRDGSLYAVLPDDIALERATEFKLGGIMKMGDGRNWLARHVMATVERNDIVVFQDVWGGRPKDPVVGRRSSRVLFDRSNVYNFLLFDDLNVESIIRTLREMSSFLLVGITTRIPDGATITDRSTVDEGFIGALAQGASEIYVTAYDQESFVVWEAPAPSVAGNADSDEENRAP